MTGDKYGRIVNYRIKHEDYAEYLEIKDFIINDLGADLCFVQWNLLRAFFNGMNKTAPLDQDKIELKFLRQNIQLNIGCQINYNRFKARRVPNPKPPVVKTDREFKLPLLLEDFPLLSKKARSFWKKQIIAREIVTVDDFLCLRRTLVSTGNPKPHKSFFKRFHSIVKQLFTNGLKWVKRS